MRKIFQIWFAFFAASLFYACDKEDDFVYPDLVTEIVCLQTDAQGYGYRLLTDEGKEWNIPSKQRPSKLTPDSIYRVISQYAPSYSEKESKEANIYLLQSAISPLPQPASSFEKTYTDPVSIQSIWKSGEYLNLILKVMYKDQEHMLAFIDDGTILTEDGRKELSITLYHDRNNDVEGFYRKFYLSVPLWHYNDILQTGDRIIFHLNTYEEVMTHRTFTF